MDDRMIEEALRAGPPDEPVYPGRGPDLGLGMRMRATSGPASVRSGRSAAVLPAVLAACIVLAALVVVRWPSPPSGEGPLQVSSSPVASVIAEAVPPPAGLVDRWVGSVRPIDGLEPPATRATVDIRGAELRFDAGPGAGALFPSAVTWHAPDLLDLTAMTHAGGCDPFDPGTYRWSLTPGGTSLTLSLVTDECAARAKVLRGVWTHTACREATDDCLGPLEAGIYASNEFDPTGDGEAAQLIYTVPDGWANTLDTGTSYFLRPTADYLADAGSDGNDGVHGIYLQAGTMATTQPRDCTGVDDPGVAHTAQAIAAHLLTLPGVRATDRGTLDIGGRTGSMIDIAIDPAWTAACPWSGDAPFRSLIGWADLPSGSGVWGTGAGARQRVVLLDAAPARVVSIWLDTTGDRFGDLVAKAMPIVMSMRFGDPSAAPPAAPSSLPTGVP